MNQAVRMSNRPVYINPAGVAVLPGVLGQREPGLTGHTPTVLLIEDDRAVLRSIVRLLRSRAYRVLTAQSGADSLRVIEEHTDVDVVLIDIVLPDMSGMQVAALIETKHPNTPVIFATGVSNVGELKGIEEGRLLRKPFTERDLFDKLSAALKRD